MLDTVNLLQILGILLRGIKIITRIFHFLFRHVIDFRFVTIDAQPHSSGKNSSSRCIKNAERLHTFCTVPKCHPHIEYEHRYEHRFLD